MSESKIALFLPALTGGGAERVMLHLLQAFAKNGVPSELVVADARGEYAAQALDYGRIVDLKVPSIIRVLPNLVKYLRRERPTVILSALEHGNLTALWARKIAGVQTRCCITTHSTVSHTWGQSGSFAARRIPTLARRFYPWAEYIVAVSRGVAEDLSAVTGLPQERIAVIHNPVVTPNMLEQADDLTNHTWLDTEGPPVILSAGRLTQAKDFSTLIRAFSIVRAHINVRLVILGEGPQRELLEKLICSLGLAEDVRMPGFVANPFAYMSRAAVFALSSAWEGFGNVLVEAMACGCPVVATDCPGGPAEILDYGQFGKMVRVGDPVMMANGIESALSNSPDKEMLKKRSEEFTADRAAHKYLNLIELLRL